MQGPAIPRIITISTPDGAVLTADSKVLAQLEAMRLYEERIYINTALASDRGYYNLTEIR